MNTLYLNCAMGAAGDMLTAALYELLEDKNGFLDTLNHCGLPGVQWRAEKASTLGVEGTHMVVQVLGAEEEEHSHGHHHHSGLAEIHHWMEDSGLPQEVIDRAKAVYDRLASAESKAHGCPVEEVHFHEVGALDAVADVLAACYGLLLLAPERVVASAVHVGYGTVKCAHGILPVPAPATAILLEGVPAYSEEVEGELCTPTGAALVTEFADCFGMEPNFAWFKEGIGVGKKVFSKPNCLRAILGEAE